MSNLKTISERTLTREERRMRDKINKEVMEKYDLFADKFLQFFTEHENPDAPEIAEKVKVMDAQWRVYCAGRNLKTEAYTLFKKYSETVIENYNKQINETATEMAS